MAVLIKKTESEEMIRPNVIVRLANSAGASNHYGRMVCQILEAEGPLQKGGRWF